MLKVKMTHPQSQNKELNYDNQIFGTKNRINHLLIDTIFRYSKLGNQIILPLWNEMMFQGASATSFGMSFQKPAIQPIR